jgi:D-sedoheptulose 7-phosphate isomerase
MTTKSVQRAQIDAALLQARESLDLLMNNEQALARIEQAAALLIRTFESGGRVFSCGNGGSMSDAIHFAEELTGRFRGNRKGLPALAISDVGHISCVANDFGYEQVFSRYLQSHGRAGDCLLAISTSGKSANVVNAAVVAKELGMTVLALTGRDKSQLDVLADVGVVTVAGEIADRVQELHIQVIHILIELVERRLFPESYPEASSQ